MNNLEFLNLLGKNNNGYNKSFFICKPFKGFKYKVIVRDKYGFHRMGYQSLLRGAKPSIKSAIFKTNYFKNYLEENSKNYNKRKYKILSDYRGTDKNIKIWTKYGNCLCLPASLYNNKLPTILSAINKNSYALNRLKEIHQDKYSYPNFNYINAKTKFEILCNTTGNTFYRSYDSHKKTKNNTYFKNIFTTERFVEKASKIHNGKYTYKKSIYKNAKTKLIITCLDHGDFKQVPNNHLSGQGCQKCANKLKMGNFTTWKNTLPKNKGILYLIQCYNKEEVFLKIGITCKSIKERYRKQKLMPYNYKVLIFYEDIDRYNVWSNERFIKKLYKQYKYIPKIKFGGYTECFNIESKKEILEFINNFKDVNINKNFAKIWHLAAKCELFIRENNIDIKEYSKKYLKKLAEKQDNN